MSYKNKKLLYKMGNKNNGVVFLNKEHGFTNLLIVHNAI